MSMSSPHWDPSPEDTPLRPTAQNSREFQAEDATDDSLSVPGPSSYSSTLVRLLFSPFRPSFYLR